MCKESDENNHLASACRGANTWCCKDGYVFLLRQEYEAIVQYLVGKSEVRKEFDSRISDQGDFLLYDQKTRCQFLNEEESCELHSLGIKPTECFWWPAHVYMTDDGELEIRVSECCSGCKFISKDSDHLKIVEQQARAIGLPLLRRFRIAHSYEVNYKVSKTIEDPK